MRTIRKAAFYFGIANIIFGVLALIGPFTTNNRKNVISRNPGRLFGFMANNWLHGADHMGAGILGIFASRTQRAARWYMLGNGIGYGLLALLGWNTVGTKPGIYRVVGFPTDWKTNIFHTIWASIGFGYGLAASDLRFEDVTETLRDLSKSPEDVPVPLVEEIA
jgi:hypothetical protein